MPTCGTTCSALSAAVHCSEGVPTGLSSLARRAAVTCRDPRDSCCFHDGAYLSSELVWASVVMMMRHALRPAIHYVLLNAIASSSNSDSLACNWTVKLCTPSTTAECFFMSLSPLSIAALSGLRTKCGAGLLGRCSPLEAPASGSLGVPSAASPSRPRSSSEQCLPCFCLHAADCSWSFDFGNHNLPAAFVGALPAYRSASVVAVATVLVLPVIVPLGLPRRRSTTRVTTLSVGALPSSRMVADSTLEAIPRQLAATRRRKATNATSSCS